ncbi:uncharacterized protein [Haliotis cracherodii]|uniref:uncharacterized protein n=1 Tax=Haliotis cracherodii TaxID=6455 RepID=UPI0039E82AE7
MEIFVITLIVSCVLGVHGHDNHTETDPQPQTSKDDYCLFGVKDGLPTGECRLSPGEDAGVIVGICAVIVVGIGIIYCCCCKGRRRGNSDIICCNCGNSQGQNTQSSGNEAPRKEKDPPPSYDECNA